MCKWHYTTIQEATHTEATHREATRQHNDTYKCNRYYYTFILGQIGMVILVLIGQLDNTQRENVTGRLTD